jgi:hypothetical protein
LCQLSQWCRNLRNVFYKPLIVIGQTQETFYHCHRRRPKPLLNYFNILRIASILFFETTFPRNVTLSSQNSLFENLSYNWWSRKVWSTILKCYSCFSLNLKYTKISSIQIITNRSINYPNILFIKFIKVAGALVNPKDITKNS